MRKLHVIPAYGRTYATPELAVQDWLDGKDFKILNGPYLSIRGRQGLHPCGLEPRRPIAAHRPRSGDRVRWVAPSVVRTSIPYRGTASGQRAKLASYV